MARNRTIPADFPRWEAWHTVDREARLLFVFLWTIADDAGRLVFDAFEIDKALFPHDRDSLYLIEGWIDELRRADLVEKYTVENVTYLRVRQWKKFQKVQHPGQPKCPAPVRPAPAAAPEAEGESHEESPSTLSPSASKPDPHEDVFLSGESHEESARSRVASVSEVAPHETPSDRHEIDPSIRALSIDPSVAFTPEEVVRELKSALADAKRDKSHTARVRYVELAGRQAGVWRGHGAPTAGAPAATTSPDVLMRGRASARHADGR
jgi:hypothetical protein